MSTKALKRPTKRTTRDVMGEPCIECGERANATEDLTVELAKDAMDFLYEDPATLRRLAQRDYRPQDNGKWIHLLCFTSYASAMEAALAARTPRRGRHGR